MEQDLKPFSYGKLLIKFDQHCISCTAKITNSSAIVNSLIKYRSKEEVENMRQNFDPIERIRQFLQDNKIATEEDLKAIDKEIKEIMIETVDFAQTSPEPEAFELYTDILN